MPQADFATHPGAQRGVSMPCLQWGFGRWGEVSFSVSAQCPPCRLAALLDRTLWVQVPSLPQSGNLSAVSTGILKNQVTEPSLRVRYPVSVVSTCCERVLSLRRTDWERLALRPCLLLRAMWGAPGLGALEDHWLSSQPPPCPKFHRKGKVHSASF